MLKTSANPFRTLKVMFSLKLSLFNENFPKHIVCCVVIKCQEMQNLVCHQSGAMTHKNIAILMLTYLCDAVYNDLLCVGEQSRGGAAGRPVAPGQSR